MMTAMPIIAIASAHPSPASGEQTARWRGIAILALIVLVAVIVRAPYLGDPAADRDEQLYSVIGLGWLDGQIPYRDMWDRKQPGLFALFALFHAIGGRSVWAFELAGLACTMLAGWQVYRIALRIGTQFAAVIVAIVFLFNIPLFIIHLGQVETFLFPLLLGQLMLAASAFASADRTRVVMILCALMLVGGVALQIKLSIGPFCVLLGVLALIRLKQLGFGPFHIIGLLGVFAAIGLAPTMLFSAYFWYHGAFESYFQANFVSIFFRGTMPAPMIARFGTHLILAAFPLLLYAVLAAAEARSNADPAARRVYRLVIAFAAMGFVALLGAGYPFVHYFGPALPFVCLLAAPFFSFHPSGKLFGYLAVILSMITASFDEQVVRTASHRQAIPALTRMITSQVPKNECLFVFAGPTILYETTQRCIPSRLVYPDHFTNPREVRALDVEITRELARILDSRPGAITMTDDLATEMYNQTTVAMVTEAVERDYTLVGTAFRFPRSVEVFIRNDLVTAEREQSPIPITSLSDLFTKFGERDQ